MVSHLKTTSVPESPVSDFRKWAGHGMLLAEENIQSFLWDGAGGSKGPDQLRQCCDLPACHQSSLSGLAQEVTPV